MMKENLHGSDAYATLAEAGFAWDSQEQTWFKTKRPVDNTGREMASQFTDDDNEPSGIVNIRFVGHPEDVKAVQEQLGAVLNFIDVSKLYPRRQGPGVSLYTQVKRTRTQLRGKAASLAAKRKLR